MATFSSSRLLLFPRLPCDQPDNNSDVGNDNNGHSLDDHVTHHSATPSIIPSTFGIIRDFIILSINIVFISIYIVPLQLPLSSSTPSTMLNYIELFKLPQSKPNQMKKVFFCSHQPPTQKKNRKRYKGHYHDHDHNP